MVLTDASRLNGIGFRIREKLFTVTWVQGKTHYIADALSRYSVFGPHEMEFPVEDIAKCFRVNKLLSLSGITTMVDTDYNNLVSSPLPLPNL